MNKCSKCNIKNDYCLGCREYQSRFLHEHKCITAEECSQIQNHYADKLYNICTECLMQGCEICESVNACKICDKDYYKIQYNSSEEECILECNKEGYYPTQDKDQKLCKKCLVYNCSNCLENNKQCVKCLDDFYYTKTQNICTKKCQEGYFADEKNKLCQSCNVIDCYKCEKSGVCLKCFDDFYVQDYKKCVIKCPQQRYYQNEFMKQCQNCVSFECLNCQQSFKICEKCEFKYILYQGNCVKECPQDRYLSQTTKTCEICSKQCTKCSEIGNCLSCDQGFYINFDDNQCYEKCPSSYYIEMQQCEKCDESCKECEMNQSLCTECHSDKFQYYNTCLDECPSQTFKKYDMVIKKECIDCHESCLNCVNDYSCNRCKDGYFKPEELKDQYSFCQPCLKNCSRCKDTESCNLCVESYYLQDYQECVKDCTKQGYQKKDNMCVSSNNDEITSSQIIFIILIICIFFLVMGIIILFFYFKRKKCNIQNEQSQDSKSSQLSMQLLQKSKKINKNQSHNFLSITDSNDTDIKDLLVDNSIIDVSKNDFNKVQDKLNNKNNNSMNEEVKFDDYLLNNDKKNKSNNSISIDEQNKINLQIKENNTSLPDNNIEILQALQGVNETINIDQSFGKNKQLQQPDEITYQDFKKKYRKLENLGEGTFGVVDKYISTRTKRLVAIKRFKFINNMDILNQGLKEALVLKIANENCKNIIKLEKYFYILKKFKINKQKAKFNKMNQFGIKNNNENNYTNSNNNIYSQNSLKDESDSIETISDDSSSSFSEEEIQINEKTSQNYNSNYQNLQIKGNSYNKSKQCSTLESIEMIDTCSNINNNSFDKEQTSCNTIQEIQQHKLKNYQKKENTFYEQQKQKYLQEFQQSTIQISSNQFGSLGSSSDIQSQILLKSQQLLKIQSSQNLDGQQQQQNTIKTQNYKAISEEAEYSQNQQFIDENQEDVLKQTRRLSDNEKSQRLYHLDAEDLKSYIQKQNNTLHKSNPNLKLRNSQNDNNNKSLLIDTQQQISINDLQLVSQKQDNSPLKDEYINTLEELGKLESEQYLNNDSNVNSNQNQQDTLTIYTKNNSTFINNDNQSLLNDKQQNQNTLQNQLTDEFESNDNDFEDYLQGFSNKKTMNTTISQNNNKSQQQSMNKLSLKYNQNNFKKSMDNQKQEDSQTKQNEIEKIEILNNQKLNKDNQNDDYIITKQLALVLELADFSLQDLLQKHIKNKTKFQQSEIIILIKQMSESLTMLHNNLNIAHRDIKPQNILIINKQFKLCDLGVAKCIENTYQVTQNHTLTGTLNYISPEEKINYIRFLQNFGSQQPYNAFQSDVFSLGITLYEVITQKNINGLNDNKQMLERSIKNILMKCQYINQPILDLIAKMLQWDPSKRINSKQLFLQFEQIL